LRYFDKLHAARFSGTAASSEHLLGVVAGFVVAPTGCALLGRAGRDPSITVDIFGLLRGEADDGVVRIASALAVMVCQSSPRCTPRSYRVRVGRVPVDRGHPSMIRSRARRIVSHEPDDESAEGR
jgi:hypothetical protein